jgi:hypothetical protein
MFAPHSGTILTEGQPLSATPLTSHASCRLRR